jgi:hypothetical protein
VEITDAVQCSAGTHEDSPQDRRYRRYRLKIKYEHERKLPGANQEELLESFLADMSQNVTSASLKHQLGYKTTLDKQHVIEEGEGNTCDKCKCFTHKRNSCLAMLDANTFVCGKCPRKKSS